MDILNIILRLQKRIAKEKNAFYVNQFSNTANLNSHYRELGPEIYNQLDGKIDAFVAGVGTGGTITGVGKYLKSKNKNCQLVLADPKGSILRDLIKKGKLNEKVGSWIVEGIGEDFCPPLFNDKFIDEAYEISDAKAVRTCSDLLKKRRNSCRVIIRYFDCSRNKILQETNKKKKNVVTLVCDAGDKYLRKIYNESWRIKEGLDFKKKENNLCDLVSYRYSSHLVPTIGQNSSCSLAFKLMHENNIGYILVSNSKK